MTFDPVTARVAAAKVAYPDPGAPLRWSLSTPWEVPDDPCPAR